MIERAWSSEDGFIIAYLRRSHGVRSILLNDDGDTSEIHGQGIDLEKKWMKIEDQYLKTRCLHEITLWEENRIVVIKAVQNGKERVFRCVCRGTLVNRGGSPHGIEQILVATHTDEFSAGKYVETIPLPEHMPILLRNGRELVGLVQGWVLKAEIMTT